MSQDGSATVYPGAICGLSRPTTEAAGELATQTEERCSGLPASLSPVAGPDQNKGRKCGPQTAGELG